MSGLECARISETIVEFLEQSLGDALLAVITTGSVASGDYKPKWSDIDLLVVVDELNTKTKRTLARIIHEESPTVIRSLL